MTALTATPSPDQSFLIGVAVLFLWGLLDCFWGYRIFRFAVALLGALAGGWLAAAAAVQLNLGETARWIGFAVGALLGAWLSAGVLMFGVFVLGFALGFVVALSLLPVLPDLVLLAVAGGVGLVAGLLALAVQRVVISAATAGSGAFRVALAAAFYFERLDWQRYLRQPELLRGLVAARPWISVVTLVLGVFGLLVQLSHSDAPKKAE